MLHYHKRVDFRLGGVARAVADMTAVLAREGLDVALATGGIDDPAGVWASRAGGGPELITVPPLGRGGRLSPEGARAMRRAVQSADVVHLHAVWSPSNLQAAAIARKLGVPYVITVHGMLGRWSMSSSRVKKQTFLAMGGSRYLRNAAAVHFACADERDQAARYVRPSQAVVIPLALDLEPFRPATHRPRAEGAPHRVLFLSRLHRVKGVEHLIEGAAIARDRVGPIELTIAGSGDDAYEREMRVLAERLGVPAVFTGFVDGGAKVGLYEHADAFVLPSAHENFGLAWAEAMASGVPTIVSRQVGPAAEIGASGAGVVVERTPGSIADALASVLGNESRRLAMGEKGRAWALSFLDPGAVAGALRGVYEGLPVKNR
ncbi:MAG: glycosyltransferase [Phycisphaerales bacterium]